MTNVTGARLTTTSNRLIVDMSSQIATLDPNEAPFLTLLKQAKSSGSRVVHNPKFDWLEDAELEKADKTGAAVAANATSITVANGGLFRVGDIITAPSTGETMRVTAVSGNSLTVYGEGTGNGVKNAITSGAAILIIGSAMAENSGARSRLSTEPETKTNYTQIFKTPIEISGTAEASDMYGGKDRAFARRKASQEHKRDICRSLYFGKPLQSSLTAQRTMGGLCHFIGSDNGGVTTTFNSSTLPLTWRNFDNYVMQPLFAHGTKDKLLIAGPSLISALNGFHLDKAFTEMDSSETFGVKTSRLLSSFGELKVVYDPLLADHYAGYGFAIDMANVRYAYLKGRDTKLRTNIQPPDQDGVIDEFITECSLEVRQPKAHVLIKGCYIPSATA